MRVRFFALTLVALLAAPAVQANGLTGAWLTGPDNKGQVAHVQISPCGGAFCGWVARTFDKTGRLIKGPNDGKRVLWDLKAAQANVYEGKVLLPLYGKTINGKLLVAGKRLTVKGCLGPICQSQNWTRLE